MPDFLEDSKGFQGGEKFVALLNAGLDLVGNDFIPEIARELEIIPGSVQRWAAGIGLPMPGMQVLVIQKIRKRAEELAR